MNKMGFNVKMKSEGILYAVLIGLLFFFIINMKDVYQFVSKIKTGQLFQKPNTEEVEKPVDKPKEEYEVVKPIGQDYGVCSKTVSESGGDKLITVKLYHSNNKLKSIVEELNFSGTSDEYMNYIYSENNRYKKRKTTNLKLKGYSIVTSQSSSTALKISSVIDLSKASIKNIKIESDETLELVGVYNQDTVQVTEEYASLGFECEW
ncbi:MAG: hypothetical protein RSB77_00225 [Bacilli bacterium]